MLCTALCAAKPTAAQVKAPNLDVAWSAPPECPGREAVLEILRARVPEGRAALDLRARAQIVRRGAEYRMTLELESLGTRASRRLTQSQCAPLAEAAAVLIALAIESQAQNAAPEAPQAPSAIAEAEAVATPAPVQADAGSPHTDSTQSRREPAPETRTETAAAPQSSSTSPPGASAHERAAERPELVSPRASVIAPRRLHLQLSAAVRAGLGTLPQQPALGVQAQLALRISALQLSLGVTYWPAREQGSPTYPSARLRGSGIVTDVGFGWHLTATPFVLTPALNLELGQLSGEATGIEGPELQRALWLAAGPCASIAVNLSYDWAVALELSALVPISRTHWLVRTPAGDVQAFVAAALAPRLSLRIGYLLR